MRQLESVWPLSLTGKERNLVMFSQPDSVAESSPDGFETP
jgi:hypothetical protein